jgi:hypothetical protein
MKNMQKIIVPLICGFLLISGVWFLNDGNPATPFERDHEQYEEEAGSKRAYFEWFISRDPNTGQIPEGIRGRELNWVKTVGYRRSGIQGLQVSNSYGSAGPSQRGGRTRALAFDVRYNGTSNRVVLSGGVQGGIFRSADGGITWAFVHPPNEVRSVTCIAQDPRPGSQDTWYAGTGEAIGSGSYPNALVFGHGMFKSTDNGLTWTKLASTVGGSSEFSYDSDFDFTTNVSVHPGTGHVYVAGGGGSILRSRDGGATWQYVIRNASPSTTIANITDLVINKTGTRLFAAITGITRDRASAGVWTSTSGDPNTWTRIAGGSQNQPDSVAGWRAYDPRMTDGSEAGWGRIVLGLSANEDLYVLVENAKKASSSESEADLFKANLSTTPITWSQNLGGSLVAKRNGTTDNFFATQGGYDMDVIGHPTNNNMIYVGGVTLIRSTDGFQTPANSYFMGGNIGSQVSSTYDDPDRVSHVDYHRLRFDPSNPNRMIAASDGALAVTPNAAAAKVSWENASAQMQTMQYYHVGIDPRVNTRTFIGGTQDNATTFRDAEGLFTGQAKVDSNDHFRVVGGDGGQTFLFRNASNQLYMLASVQEQVMYRLALFGNGSLDNITPNNIGKDRFVTYFHLDEDNPNNLYFPSNDTLYRTTSPTTVSPSTWTRVSGVDQLLTGEIFSLATTKGNYTANNMLYMGTANGKIFRLRDPANSTTAAPVDITPSGMPSNVVVIDISVNPRNHDTVMAAVSNYNAVSLYWTGNATAAVPTWQAVEGNLSLPSVRSCEVIATTSGVEYYVGTTVGLFSTRTISDNTTNWTREDGGPGGMMNTCIIQSLVSRWRDNTLIVGTHSNGMFVTNVGGAITGPTGVNDPIRDDKNFIVKAYPTIVNNIISYQAGTMLNVRSIQVQVFSLGGQLVYNQTSPYGSGQINMGALPSGPYILTITSNDRKYQFVRRFTKS